VRVHPRHVAAADHVTRADAAEVKLSQALAFDATVAPIKVGPEPPIGGRVVVVGFGTQGSTSDGRLRSLGSTTLAPELCGTDNAVMMCHRSTEGSSCPGDSGGPVVTDTPQGAVLVAIHNGAFCEPGQSMVAARIAAPEIGDFLRGNDAPPEAPHGGATGLRPYDTRVGHPLTCYADGFLGTPPLSASAEVIDSVGNPMGLADAGLRYVFQTPDVGRFPGCRVTVSNAGGTYRGALRTGTAAVIPLRPPALTLRIATDSYIADSLTDAATYTYEVRSAAGAVVASATTPRPQALARTRRPAGRYEVCVITARTADYETGRACVFDTFGKLTAYRLTASRRRARLSVRCDGGACLGKVSVRWNGGRLTFGSVALRAGERRGLTANTGASRYSGLRRHTLRLYVDEERVGTIRR
jgi:hypothetical protein